MAGLEGIVRPFQRPDTLARKRLVASNDKIDVTPASIVWGTSGTVASAHQVDEIPQDGSFTVLVCDDKYEETDRLVDVRRIVQTLPNGTKNPDNYIDLERPYRVYFEKKELASKKANETQSWTNAFETATFETTNSSNNKCRSVFTLNRSLS